MFTKGINSTFVELIGGWLKLFMLVFQEVINSVND